MKFGNVKFNIIDFKHIRDLFTDYTTENYDYAKYFARKKSVFSKNI